MKPILALVLAIPLVGMATFVRTFPKSSGDIAAAAMKFRDALTDEQKSAALFPFTDEQRRDWHYIPRDNEGIAFNDLTDVQKPLAHALLRSTLSSAGYHKTTTIMFLDQVLYELETARGRTAANRSPGRYWIAIFGNPSVDADWGWRIQGHHVSLNFSSIANEITIASPAFFGANPHEIRSGPFAGLRALGAEEDLARELLVMLSGEQRTRATLEGEVPRDIILSPGRQADLLGEPKGLPWSSMNDDQRRVLWLLIEEYVGNQQRELADAQIARIDNAGREGIHFAWIGGMEPGVAFYYRVQGPTFVIEYDNTQGQANHSHTVWRDLAKDFGEDLLLEHYRENPLPHEHR
jgi:hypothetical protein